MKVILVDDENLVRESIKACIDWRAEGYFIVGEAQNAAEALELVESALPDVAIVDIHMPGMNGLELTQLLRTRHPALQVVILTGYARFEYARSAIAAGVINYLLKPVDKNELLGVLRQIGAQAESEQRKSAYVETLQRESLDWEARLKEQYTHFMLTGEPAGFDLRPDKLTAFWPNLTAAPMRVALADGDDCHPAETSGEREAGRRALADILGEALSPECVVCALRDSIGRAVLLVEAGRFSDDDSLRHLCAQARQQLRDRLGYTATIGMSGVATGVNQIKTSYRQALQALGRRLLCGPDQTFFYTAPAAHPPQSAVFSPWRETLIGLRTGNTALLSELAQRLLEAAAQAGSLDLLALSVGEMVAAANLFCFERGLEPLWPEARETLHAWKLIDDFRSRQALQSWLASQFCRLIALSRAQRKTASPSQRVETILQHIECNLSDPALSLETIAARVFLNPHYLSNLFKKEMGVSLFSYIAECRMEKARALIAAGVTNIEQLAAKTGYNDGYYFSKCFKKHTGLSVSNYLKNRM
jgi:two-component system response regulator YesN